MHLGLRVLGLRVSSCVNPHPPEAAGVGSASLFWVLLLWLLRAQLSRRRPPPPSFSHLFQTVVLLPSLTTKKRKQKARKQLLSRALLAIALGVTGKPGSWYLLYAVILSLFLRDFKTRQKVLPTSWPLSSNLLEPRFSESIHLYSPSL